MKINAEPAPGTKATIFYSDSSKGKFRLFLKKEAVGISVNFETVGIAIKSGKPAFLSHPIAIGKWVLIWFQIKKKDTFLSVHDGNLMSDTVKEISQNDNFDSKKSQIKKKRLLIF
jgi:hypothetical protein